MEKLSINHIYSDFFDQTLDLEYHKKFDDPNFNYNKIHLEKNSLLTDYLFDSVSKNKVSGIILNGVFCLDAYNLTLEHDALSLHTNVCNLIKVNSDGLKSFNTFGPAFEKAIITQTNNNLNGKNVLILGADTVIGKSISFQSIWSDCKVLTMVTVNPNGSRRFMDECQHNTRNTVKSCAFNTNKLKTYTTEADIIVDCSGYISYNNIKIFDDIKPECFVLDLHSEHTSDSLFLSYITEHKLCKVFDKKDFCKFVAEYTHRLFAY